MLYRITAISLGGTNSYAYTDYTTTNTMPNNNNSSVATPITVNTPMNLNGGLNFSLAKIKSLNERFGFMYGAVIGANVAYQKSNTDYAYLNVIPPSNPSNYSTESISSSYAPFIGLLFGARYKMSSSFYLYAEVTPNFSYTYAKATSTSTPGAYTPFNTNKVTNTYGLSGLANSGAFITIVYRL